MSLLIVGLVLFIGVHSLSIVAPAIRAGFVARLGAGPWKALHGLIALAGLVLVVVGFGAARTAPLVLYTSPRWLHWLAVILMVLVFPLLFASILGGRIRTTLQHPLLLAIKTWAFAHLLANGTLPDVLLFGSFLAWAVAARMSLKHRAARGVATAPAGRFNDLIVVALGIGLYAAFLWGVHRWLFGVAPLG